MPSLMQHIASPAFSSLVKKNWRGKPYFELGPLILTVGTWLFERGGILGYTLRDNPELLSKVMPVPNLGAYERITKQLASIWLDFLPESDPSFKKWYADPTLEAHDMIFPAYPEPKGWRKKISWEQTTELMGEAFLRGSAIGSTAPSSFRTVFENTYRPVDPERWQEAFRAGAVDSPGQRMLTLEDAIRDCLVETATWAQSEPEASAITDEEFASLWHLAE